MNGVAVGCLLGLLGSFPSYGATTYTGKGEGYMTTVGDWSFLEFKTRPGFEYEVLRSDELSQWVLDSTHYGVGQTVSRTVKYRPPAGVSGPSPALGAAAPTCAAG